MSRTALLPTSICAVLGAVLLVCPALQARAWSASVEPAIERIDAATPGALGVYLKRLSDDAELDYDAQRRWYLASTIKVPVAIAVLEAVEQGRLTLDQQIALTDADLVDGAGNLIDQPVGSRHSIDSLIRRSLRDSDSVATDMLIRLVGEDALNQRIESWVGEGFGPITTIQQVRYDAYGELHAGVAKLTPAQLLEVRAAGAPAQRYQALARVLEVDTDAFALPSVEAAFERYYASGRNSATLAAFGRLLEQLVEGERLNPQHTELLLGHMAVITTGARRIQAGLDADTPFAQKTGTQIARACNVGVIDPKQTARALVVVACLENYDALGEAEAALQQLGRLLEQQRVD